MAKVPVKVKMPPGLKAPKGKPDMSGKKGSAKGGVKKAPVPLPFKGK